MPYERRKLYESALLTWEQVTLQAPAPAWSDEYEVTSSRVLMPLTHSFEYRVGTRSWTCDGRTALWFAPGQPYRVRRPWAQRSLLLTVPGAEGRADRCEVHPVARASLALLHSRWRRGQADRLQLEEGLLAFVRSMRPDPREAPGAPHRAVERTREFLAHRFAEADSLAEIARAAHCSPYHLARIFRGRTGTSLHAYRTQLRMVRALQRLEQGEHDLSALAADLGYSSHAHFTAVFTTVYGTSPAHMRRNLIAPAASG